MSRDEVKPLSVPEGASEALAKLEASIEDVTPRVHVDFRGPHPTPIPQTAAKKARVRARASRRANRPRVASRRQRGRRS